MPDADTSETDPILSSKLPFLVDTESPDFVGDKRYYRVKGLTLKLTDPKTGKISRSINLVYAQLPSNPPKGAVLSSDGEEALDLGEEIFALKSPHDLSLSLQIVQGPCNPQTTTCPPMPPIVDPIDVSMKIEFVVEK